MQTVPARKTFSIPLYVKRCIFYSCTVQHWSLRQSLSSICRRRPGKKFLPVRAGRNLEHTVDTRSFFRRNSDLVCKTLKAGHRFTLNAIRSCNNAKKNNLSPDSLALWSSRSLLWWRWRGKSGNWCAPPRFGTCHWRKTGTVQRRPWKRCQLCKILFKKHKISFLILFTKLAWLGSLD